jgi:cell division protein ZapA (FtsZ GTPase activity inhibitor)
VSEEIKRISVRIGGVSYQLVSAENEEYTRRVAIRADEMIRRVMQNNPQLSLNMSTVLALVNALDEQTRQFQRLNAIEAQQGDADKQAAELRNELTRTREQNWEMKKEMLRLNALNREYESLLASHLAAAENADAADSPDNVIEPATIGVAPSLATPELPSVEPALEISEAGSPLSPAAERLKQTNLEDYLRENGWPQSSDA